MPPTLFSCLKWTASSSKAISSIITLTPRRVLFWHDGEGNWFARRVGALARHYQIFERLPGGVTGEDGHMQSHGLMMSPNPGKEVADRSANWKSNPPRKLREALNTKILPDLNMGKAGEGRGGFPARHGGLGENRHSG